MSSTAVHREELGLKLSYNCPSWRWNIITNISNLDRESEKNEILQHRVTDK